MLNKFQVKIVKSVVSQNERYWKAIENEIAAIRERFHLGEYQSYYKIDPDTMEQVRMYCQFETKHVKKYLNMGLDLSVMQIIDGIQMGLIAAKHSPRLCSDNEVPSENLLPQIEEKLEAKEIEDKPEALEHAIRNEQSSTGTVLKKAATYSLFSVVVLFIGISYAVYLTVSLNNKSASEKIEVERELNQTRKEELKSSVAIEKLKLRFTQKLNRIGASQSRLEKMRERIYDLGSFIALKEQEDKKNLDDLHRLADAGSLSKKEKEGIEKRIKKYNETCQWVVEQKQIDRFINDLQNLQKRDKEHERLSGLFKRAVDNLFALQMCLAEEGLTSCADKADKPDDDLLDILDEYSEILIEEVDAIIEDSAR